MKAFITYEGLPLNSGGAHSLGTKSPEKVYSDATKFIETFTTAKRPASLKVIFYASQSGAYKSLPILWELIKKMGLPSFGSWNLKQNKQRFFTFKLRGIKTGLSILEKYSGLPNNEYGPIVISVLWHFKFIDPRSRETLPGQHEIPSLDERIYNSEIYLRLSRKSTISVWLAFPFSSLDEYALKYISDATDCLPFKPSDKHWKIWKQSAKGNWTSKTLTLNAG
ncbi:MAG: hypothetical protein ABIQ88_01365 [Chitinophagaceae bacterium]